MPEGSPSVLVIRLDAIGDALALTPLLAELRARTIPVDLVLGANNGGLFSAAAARRVFTSPFALRSSDADNLALIERFGSELAARGYTHAIVATEDPGGYRLARAVRAPVRIGFFNGWGKPLKSLWSRAFLTDAVYRSAGLDARGPHECETLFRLGAPLVGSASPTHDLERLRPLILEREPERDDRVAVQVTDKWERLGIGFDEVVDLVHRIAPDQALRLIASDRERSFADRFARAANLPVECFGAVEPWKSAIASACAIVAPDSGAVHVAGMIGTPTVAVFPASPDFALQVARWSPWAAPHRIVRADRGWPQRTAEALAQLLVSGRA
jgi:ADP-heptose:LPS heptosyltransferase